MKRLIAAVASCSMVTVSAADSTCLSIEPGVTTHYVGNERHVYVDTKVYRTLKGAASSLDGTRVPGALIEIFTDPQYLLPPSGGSGRREQKRIAACRSNVKGEFSFSNIPNGRYEVRGSSDDTRTGWNVSQVYVILDSERGSTADLKILMTLGS